MVKIETSYLANASSMTCNSQRRTYWPLK